MAIGPSGIACTACGPCYSAIASTAHTYTSPATYTAILLNSASAGVATAQIIVVPSASPPAVGGRAPQGAQPVRLGSQGCDSFAGTAGCAYRR
jgi:hypothetical protein